MNTGFVKDLIVKRNLLVINTNDARIGIMHRVDTMRYKCARNYKFVIKRLYSNKAIYNGTTPWRV